MVNHIQSILKYKAVFLTAIFLLTTFSVLAVPISWHYESVDNNGDVGYGLDLALDSFNRPHISYSSFDDGHIKYARQLKDGSWDIQVVEQLEGRIMTSIAVDQRNQPHILYLDWNNQCLKYAHLLYNEWRIETIDPVVGYMNRLNCPSITTDSYGRIHIVYYDHSTDHMMYARKNTAISLTSSKSWHFEIIDSNLNLHFWPLPSIATDPITNQVRVAYYGHRSLMHAVQLGIDDWQTEVVGPDCGVNPSLAIGENGLSAISYMHGEDIIEDDLCLMCARQDKSGGWICEILDPYPRSGTDSSITVDSNNVPHIAHIRYSENSVVHVYWTPSGWRYEFVAADIGGSGGPGMVSIDLRTDQQACIAFRRRPGSQNILSYAWRT